MVAQMVKKKKKKNFRLSNGTGKFLNVFTKASHCFISWLRLIQSTVYTLYSFYDIF